MMRMERAVVNILVFTLLVRPTEGVTPPSRTKMKEKIGIRYGVVD